VLVFIDTEMGECRVVAVGVWEEEVLPTDDALFFRDVLMKDRASGSGGGCSGGGRWLLVYLKTFRAADLSQLRRCLESD
jgi:hypothetical protein